MATFPNLPGILVNTIDQGLLTRTTPRNKSTIVLGTSATGPTDPFQVLDRAAVAQEIGFSGNLLQGIEEVASFSDNVIGYRLGTKQMSLTGVGLELATGVAISNVAVSNGTATITASGHGLAAGQQTVIAGLTHSALNGTQLVLSVSGTTFTFATTSANITSVSDTGTSSQVVKPGFTITFGEVAATAQTDYKIWYKQGDLAIWLGSELVWSNDSGLGVTDVGDIQIGGLGLVSTSQGLFLGQASTSSPTLANAVTVQAAAALTGTSTEPLPVLTQPVTGLGMSGRQTYVALAKALDLLSNFPVDQVYCPAALFDQPNVAYYVPSDITTAANNPANNADALDWLKVTDDGLGNKTYQWASESTDSNGASVSPMSGSVTTAAARIAAGFYEVSFGYLLATFCYGQGFALGPGCIGVLGTSRPASFRLADTRSWVGALPKYDATGVIPTTAGRGLLGIPTLVGTTATRLNPLCADFSTGYRLPGLFLTNEGFYDGTPVLDKNQNKVDIGAFLHVVADQAVLSNAFQANYAGNIAGVVCGYLSGLDEKLNLTYKVMNVIQLWRASTAQLDALTQAKISVLRFIGNGQSPVLLHGMTAAGPNSDFTTLLRQRIKFLLVKMIRDLGLPFVGQASNDGLSLASFHTKLDSGARNLQRRGYVQSADFNIHATLADQRIGHTTVDVTWNPADELIQITTNVAIVRP